MEGLCPNCKASADLVTIESVEYIQCPECGWFETLSDGSLSACDPPQSRVDPKAVSEHDQDDPNILLHESPAATPEVGPIQDSVTPTSGKPGEIDEDDEDEVHGRIHFED